LCMYVSPVEGKKIRPGMTVQISPSTVRKEEYGVMLGKVVSVGEFPVTYQAMLRVLGSDELIRALPVGGASIEVVVEPTKAETDSGYQWTSPKGPPTTVQSGTFVAASIITEERRPIELIFAS
jgi:HlyD family secretion protein